MTTREGLKSGKAKRLLVKDLVTPHWRKVLNDKEMRTRHTHHWVTGHFRDDRLITVQCTRCGVIIPAGALTRQS